MSEMIERVARALFEEWLTKEGVIREQAQNGPYPPWERQGEMGHRPWLQSARAAINAMREPTDDMWSAMRLANLNIAGGYGGPSGWEAAIDAALKD